MTAPPLEKSRRQLWLAALKPPMYSVAVVPIWVGTAIARWETGEVDWGTFTQFLTAAIAIVAWSNISNDVFDSETGIDRNKHHSLVNLTANKSLVFWIGNGCLLIGLGLILRIAYDQQDITVLALIGAACLLGYLYQGPPFRLGYQGLGEILCFFAYGPITLSAVYYSQTQSWSGVNLLASILLGWVTSLILYCSHFHQVEDDRKAGKRSPIVRLGTARGAQLLPGICGILFGLLLLFVLMGQFPVWTLLMGGSLPYAVKLCRFIGAHHHQPQLVQNCKFIAVALHFWSGLLLGLGFMLAAQPWESFGLA
ncbi:2-carboxy-1,4-naphthoquinone phytyltransferase [Lyngbya confervoides]|uniref:2-carboxy-1,4-naphthoquinone phytyltransferase n=1 Tax=Lyngbya confervoides BDU141951 TaxID=1574623 RepID=A0ABD4T5H8_9CYAN|nr:2-carboxy-1,4-naphthoquinone phytyltransferase [Lyngbya confervoides]MCM1983730.1 2-carboxy-1,4-naphthoquinone phytyltransferase [Lyngbya confervoides BDU141951]